MRNKNIEQNVIFIDGVPFGTNIVHKMLNTNNGGSLINKYPLVIIVIKKYYWKLFFGPSLFGPILNLVVG